MLLHPVSVLAAVLPALAAQSSEDTFAKMGSVLFAARADVRVCFEFSTWSAAQWATSTEHELPGSCTPAIGLRRTRGSATGACTDEDAALPSVSCLALSYAPSPHRAPPGGTIHIALEAFDSPTTEFGDALAHFEDVVPGLELLNSAGLLTSGDRDPVTPLTPTRKYRAAGKPVSIADQVLLTAHNGGKNEVETVNEQAGMNVLMTQETPLGACLPGRLSIG
ncbi:hypothetical protein AURDEDRAFT_120882 [Auricularia subglabra TFB-10046 SS5]|nr:hypothetical protein AURDEDRAFT_120882 [Auricularia subglabra TFB-10046 SS5]